MISKKNIFNLFVFGFSLSNAHNVLWKLIEHFAGDTGVIIVSPILCTLFLLIGLYILADYNYNPVEWNKLFIKKYKLSFSMSKKNLLRNLFLLKNPLSVYVSMGRIYFICMFA